MALGGGLQDLSSLFVDQDFRNAFRTDARHVGWQKINDHSQTCCTALATESHNKLESVRVFFLFASDWTRYFRNWESTVWMRPIFRLENPTYIT